MENLNDTIVALSTPTGGAIAVVRLSGADAIGIADKFFFSPRGRRLTEAKGYSLHYGRIVDDGKAIDDVVVSVFRAPDSYTGEDSVEISCHGSRFIASEIVRLAICGGARAATAGEFTRRAFLAGKMDLSQAEAVADTIAAESKAAALMASTQLRGGYSERLGELRGKLLHLAALLELELDFSEEDVEFANRKQLIELLDAIHLEIKSLSDSFTTGNAIKEGVRVAIVGRPNVGKSTLLNRLTGEDRAMVSAIAGTTRDTIEETMVLDGVLFRFIDTAGLHKSDDELEQMGIERTMKAIDKAHVIIEITDDNNACFKQFSSDKRVLRVRNKIDRDEQLSLPDGVIAISAKTGEGIERLKSAIRLTVDTDNVFQGEAVVSNSRHYDALLRADEALCRARVGLLDLLPTDLVAQDLREVLAALGEITGEITSQDILNLVFAKFCIGK